MAISNGDKFSVSKIQVMFQSEENRQRSPLLEKIHENTYKLGHQAGYICGCYFVDVVCLHQ